MFSWLKATSAADAQSPSSPPPPRLLGSVTQFLDSLLVLVHGRLALLSVEAQVGGLRLVALIVWAVLAVLALMMGVGFLGAAITVALWDGPYRLLALVVLTVLFLTLGAVTVWQARRTAAQMGAWFEATLNELRLDRERLPLSAHDWHHAQNLQADHAIKNKVKNAPKPLSPDASVGSDPKPNSLDHPSKDERS
jgi:uncharacterized membrane protein YqjE